MKGFLIGLGIGVGLGVLFAPMSGEETRNNLADRANDLSDSARELVDQGKERVRSGISSIRSQAENAINRTQQATGTEGVVSLSRSLATAGGFGRLLLFSVVSERVV